jgi:hypothetical protein
MYKVTEMNDFFKLKTYWCTELQIAEEIAKDIEDRFRIRMSITEVPDKDFWTSYANGDMITLPLKNNINFSCSRNELIDALLHEQNSIAKINAYSEIFCFNTDDDSLRQNNAYRH